MYETHLKDANQTNNSGDLWEGKEEDKGQSLERESSKGTLTLSTMFYILKVYYSCILE